MIFPYYPIHIVPDRAVPDLAWPVAFAIPPVGVMIFTGDRSSFYFAGRDTVFRLTVEDSTFRFTGENDAGL